MAGEIRQQVLALMNDKNRMEDEIKQLTEILTINGVGMHEPLVDVEGFPLRDVDVYQVRHARHQILCLQNDHKALMKQIEAGLQTYYASGDSPISNGNGVHRPVESGVHLEKCHEKPFLKVTSVTSGSPAENAGLQTDDQIVMFGTLNATNFQSLQDLASIVRYSENSVIHIQLQRGNRMLYVELIPKQWSGRGLLGCNIDVL